MKHKYQYFNIRTPAEYVTHVEINRPDKLNSWTEPMWLELKTVFDNLSHDPDVRVIIFSGAGDRAFSTGLDVVAASSSTLSGDEDNKDPSRKAVKFRRHILEFQECLTAIERCEKPVIAVLHGYSLGLAIDLSCCADIRICASDTKFSVKEVDIGLAADIGTLSRLPKVVGSFSWVKDVCLTARIFGPDEALKHGFVSAVHPTKDYAIKEAIKTATVIAGKSPVAVQGTKEILNFSRDHSVQDGLKYTAVWNSAALQTSDVLLSIQAGIQKRKATFEKL